MSDAFVILEAELPGGRSEAELRNEENNIKSLLVSAVFFRWNREGYPQRDPYGKRGSE